MAPKWPQDGPKMAPKGPKMAPKWPQHGSENALESQINTYKRKCRILRNLRYNRHLREVLREAKRHQDDPKRPQDGPKMAPRGLRMAARGPKMAPRGPKRAQDDHMFRWNTKFKKNENRRGGPRGGGPIRRVGVLTSCFGVFPREWWFYHYETHISAECRNRPPFKC